MAREARITTVDNPYDPFTQWDEWLAYDMAKGHFTFALLGRIARLASGLSPDDNTQATEDAIDEIIEMGPKGFYKKVFRDS